MKLIKTIASCLFIAAIASCNTNGKTNGTAQKTDETGSRNEVIENIMARRSIRKYKDGSVDRETLMKIMECGINAPNGQNKQSWEVRIVDKPEIMEKVKELMVRDNPDTNADMVRGCFRNAPVMVFIARDKGYDFSAYDCGLMAQNIMLSAQSLGVGSVCLGSPVRFIRQSADCAKLLGFSEGYELGLCIGLGYPDESPAAKPRDINKVKFVE